MTFDTLVERVKSLPQAKLIPESRILTFCRKIQKMDKSPDFYIDRLDGVGGSEIGAIVSHFYGASIDKNISKNLFKSAPAIAKEKLLLSFPYSTDASRRGNKIEPVIRSILELKYPEFKRREDLIQLATKHKTSKHALGNTDDVFQNSKSGQKIIFDYKSSLLVDQEESFSNIAQLNYYSEILRSHNSTPDAAFTVKLKAANEEIFADIISAYENRENDPATYQFWVDAISNNKLSCVKLEITPVAINPEFGRLCVQATERFMAELVSHENSFSIVTEKTLILDGELEEASKIEGLLYHLHAAEKAVEVLKDRANGQVNEFRERIGQPFDWPETFPVKIKEKVSINETAALEALSLSNFDTKTLFVKSESGEIDNALLLQRFIEIGGVVDESIFLQKLSHEKLNRALETCGLSENDFMESKKLTSTVSRSANDKEQHFVEMAEWSESIYQMVHKNTAIDLMNMNEENQQQNISMGMD